MGGLQQRVIVACDFPDRDSLMRFLSQFEDEKPFLKIGMELFYGAGPDLVRELRGMGHSIFLDLKLMDIPNTVRSAMRNLRKLGAEIVNLHASGGIPMMKAAAEGFREQDGGGRLIAVTVLTSIGEEQLKKELLIPASVEETVLHYAENAMNSGLDGVVCSPLEAAAVKRRCGGGFITVTPGIRYPGAGDDQQRVTTPAAASAGGSDYIVVGRPITTAKDPLAAYKKIAAEFAEGVFNPPGQSRLPRLV